MLNTLIYNLQNMEHLKKIFCKEPVPYYTHGKALHNKLIYFFFTRSADSRALEQFLPRSRHSCYE